MTEAFDTTRFMSTVHASIETAETMMSWYVSRQLELWCLNQMGFALSNSRIDSYRLRSDHLRSHSTTRATPKLSTTSYVR